MEGWIIEVLLYSLKCKTSTMFFHSVFYMAGPVYIAEIAPKHIRGTLTSLVGISTGMGILSGYVTNNLLFDKSYGWRVSRLLNCVLSCVYIVGMILMPMSPRYLCLLGINVLHLVKLIQVARVERERGRGARGAKKNSLQAGN